MSDENQESEGETVAYDSKWWSEDLSEEERQLYPEKHWDELPGASLPESVLVERNVPIEMSDGLKLAANVFRPDRDGTAPVIMAFTPFSKDHYGQRAHLGVSEKTAFEAPDPGFWVPHGYAVVIVDQRGTGRSPSGGTGGAYDYHDGIEWAGTQAWSNGNVGTLGHSGLAAFQWEVAAMDDPPDHLEALIPWGGFTDPERESGRPGGIPNVGFSASFGENIPLWQEDFEPESRPELPSVWEGTVELENITHPLLIGSAWADREHHLRGNLRAWRRASTPLEHKWLFTYHGRKWNGMYTPAEHRNMQRKFFDYFLKGSDNGLDEVPNVRLSVSESLFDFEVRYEQDWPLPRTEYTKLYLDGQDGSLHQEEVNRSATVTYDSESETESATFDITFNERIELSGHSALKLWVSPLDADDMDLFVVLRKLTADGHEVNFPMDQAPGENPVDMGFMRLSKRQLDEERSQPWLPVQKTVRAGEPEQKVEPGETVPVRIPLVGTSTAFDADETLRLEIAGSHRIDDELLHEFDSVNNGIHAIETGADHDAYLQVPVIPEAKNYSSFALEPRKSVDDT